MPDPQPAVAAERLWADSDRADHRPAATDGACTVTRSAGETGVPRTAAADQTCLYSGHDDRALLEAALRRVEQFQGLIAHADTKATVVATAAGLLFGAVATNTDALRATFADVTGLHRVAQAALALTAIGLAGVGVTLGSVLVPRTRPPDAPNVFSFSSVVDTPGQPCPQRGRAGRSGVDARHDAGAYRRGEVRCGAPGAGVGGAGCGGVRRVGGTGGDAMTPTKLPEENGELELAADRDEAQADGR